MILKAVLKMFIIFIALLHAFGISTFAGQRKGLIAGFSVGIGATYREAKNDWYAVHNTRFTFTLIDAKLGIAPTNQVQFFLTLKMASIIEEPSEEGLEFLLILTPFYWIVHSQTLAGAGFSYYLNPEAPSLFFEGGFGKSGCYVKYDIHKSLSPSRDHVDSNGIYIGMGYEFKKHISVMLNVMGLHALENNRYTKNRYDIVSLMLTLNFLAY